MVLGIRQLLGAHTITMGYIHDSKTKDTGDADLIYSRNLELPYHRDGQQQDDTIRDNIYNSGRGKCRALHSAVASLGCRIPQSDYGTAY